VVRHVPLDLGERKRMRTSATLSVFCLFCFGAGIGLLHVLVPQFPPTYRFMSEYVRSPYGPLMTFNFVALAGATGFLAVSLNAEARVHPRLRWYGPTLMAWAALFLLMLGLFPSDLQDTPRTLIGRIHDFFSTLPFACIVPTAILFVRHFTGIALWRRTMRTTLLLAGCALPGLAYAYGWQHSLKWTGLIQRASALPILLWLLCVALRLRTLPRRCSP
jgi:hypothetical protein